MLVQREPLTPQPNKPQKATQTKNKTQNKPSIVAIAKNPHPHKEFNALIFATPLSHQKVSCQYALEQNLTITPKQLKLMVKIID